MIRPRLRIPSVARPRLAVPVQAARPSFAQQIRSRHTLQPLPYEEKFNTAENGIPNFLSGPAFNIAWTQYQTHLIEKLNTMIAGMSLPSLYCPRVSSPERRLITPQTPTSRPAK